MNTQGTASPDTRPAVGKDGPATAAMVLGITGLFTSVVLVGGALGLMGVVLGAVGLKTAGPTGTGRGKAVTGVVTSLLAMVVAVLAAFFLAWYANRTQACYQPDTLRQYAQCVSRHLAKS
ncbi:DUF4190 domain-containing protein [Streptomyces termitum]|uniref:DUF4190 domain-containing protein n=1 Tax=Streptomyces termitum TaxID=67368 RepID=A0A918T9L0_9ACTN|nr:DUF4190 domain-containing protein [Streptomyces termitum]GHB08568.1 hypothetical protein GCM10010305_59450 [Streptomyces termitum]